MSRLLGALLLVACSALLVACGGGAGDEPAAEPEGETRLEVEVRPQGDQGPVQRRVVTEVPEEISPEDFQPVPRDVACAEIYGGPATARVTGTLEGEPIDATFNRRNACEMARWDRLEAILGPAPASSGG